MHKYMKIFSSRSDRAGVLFEIALLKLFSSSRSYVHAIRRRAISPEIRRSGRDGVALLFHGAGSDSDGSVRTFLGVDGGFVARVLIGSVAVQASG